MRLLLAVFYRFIAPHEGFCICLAFHSTSPGSPYSEQPFNRIGVQHLSDQEMGLCAAGRCFVYDYNNIPSLRLPNHNENWKPKLKHKFTYTHTHTQKKNLGHCAAFISCFSPLFDRLIPSIGGGISEIFPFHNGVNLF
ncbi:hypothetical protein DFH27DRAFT_104228 [Peziza echinospora]|nr:hypothetical protein DFH27DRAFT_104228 [Peziza echinospora]